MLPNCVSAAYHAWVTQTLVLLLSTESRVGGGGRDFLSVQYFHLELISHATTIFIYGIFHLLFKWL